MSNAKINEKNVTEKIVNKVALTSQEKIEYFRRMKDEAVNQIPFTKESVQVVLKSFIQSKNSEKR